MPEIRILAVPYELDLVAALAAAFPVRAISLTAYDPAFDAGARVRPIALAVLRTIARSLV
jgi:hypothetical protein